MNFIDTNILVYAYNLAEKEKRAKCAKIVKSCFEGDMQGIISNQVLSEFFYAVTSRVERPLEKEDASLIVSALIEAKTWKILNYSHDTVQRGARLCSAYKIHFWDALIAATMQENGIEKIYTENEKDFSKIPWIIVVNPLRRV